MKDIIKEYGPALIAVIAATLIIGIFLIFMGFSDSADISISVKDLFIMFGEKLYG
jgi:hypothetical protein